MPGREAIATAFLAVLLAAPHPLSGAVARSGQPVMGTVLQVTVLADDQATADGLANRAVSIARHWDDVLTTWRSEGELARLNAAAGSGPQKIGADLMSALLKIEKLVGITGGSFDPAVGPLVRLWSGAAPPSDAALNGLPPCRFEKAVQLSNGHARLAAGAALDAGGIGKGIALDAIANVLREAGVRSAFLDFGGSSQLGIGAPPGSPAGWKVIVAGIHEGDVLGTLHLRDAALSTSRALGAGSDVGPIIDPRSARPIEPPRLATVLAPNATSAEAWSKAVVILGREGLARCTVNGIHAVLADSQGSAKTPDFPLDSEAPR